MNYIKSLEFQLVESNKQRIAAKRAINEMSIFLMSDKFRGVEQNGTDKGARKDWIATSDVQNFLDNLRNVLQ